MGSFMSKNREYIAVVGTVVQASNKRGRTMKFAMAAAGMLMLTLLMSRPSEASSAFAAGVPDSVAADGVSLGEAHNYDTREAAESEAMRRCQTDSNSTEKVHSLCKIIAHFDNRCLSTALDPKAGTPGWGWAIADTESQADDQALSMCRADAGADRAPYCVIEQSVCDHSSSNN